MLSFLVTLLHLLLARVVLCQGHNKFVPPEQTAWQIELFKNVSANAAAASEAALEELLGIFDSKSFRQELASCCPSFSKLSANELQQQLANNMPFVEVASGFPSVVPKVRALLTGMSVEDGLNGSYFQSLWQKVLVHKQPFWQRVTDLRGYAQKILDNAGDDNTIFGVWIWNPDKGADPHCGKPTPWPLPVANGKCFSVPTVGVVGALHNNTSGNLSVSIWPEVDGNHRHTPSLQRKVMSRLMDAAQEAQGKPRSEVACPHEDPNSRLEVPVNNDCNVLLSHERGFFVFEDKAETRLYGLKPFKVPGKPADLEEASERGCYSLANIAQVDAGSALFGDVSAIFSSKLMLKSGLISPTDTGIASMGPTPDPPFDKVPANRSAYRPFTGLGTFQHINHVLLQNHYFWQPLPCMSPIARQFARLEGGWAHWGANNVSNCDMYSYYEVFPAANAVYPQGIRFLIATFSTLFGTATGAKLRDWATQRGWVLLWSLGLNPKNGTLSWWTLIGHSLNVSANQRIIDPQVAKKTSAAKGLPLNASTLGAFERQWKAVEDLRSLHSVIGNETWLEEWRTLLHALPRGLQIRPARAGASCPAPGPGVPECVGITADGTCVCYAGDPSQEGNIAADLDLAISV